MAHGTRIPLWVSTFATALLVPLGLVLVLGGFVPSLRAMTEIRTALSAEGSADVDGMSGQRNARLAAVTDPQHWSHASERCWDTARAVREYQASFTAGDLVCPSPTASRRAQPPAEMTYPFRPDLREDLLQMTIAQRWYRLVRSPDRPNSGPR